MAAGPSNHSAYCQCLQHWVEKHNLPKSPDCHPIAESVRELSQAMREFINITKGDILEDLEMEGLTGACQPSSATIFSWVLGPPANMVEMMPTTGETSQPTRMLRPRGRAHPFFQVIPIRLPVHLPKTPSLPASPPTKALMVLRPSRPPRLQRSCSLQWRCQNLHKQVRACPWMLGP